MLRRDKRFTSQAARRAICYGVFATTWTVTCATFRPGKILYNGSMSNARSPISESPWFWACLFASVGLMALWSMGPKYGNRQLLEERKAQGRMRAAEHASGGEMATEVSSEGNLQIPLKPLYGILAIALICAWVRLWWTHLRQAPTDAQEQSGDVATPSAAGNDP